jgi:hypothetical protein
MMPDPYFPELFEKLVAFFNRFDRLSGLRPKPEDFFREFDEIFVHHSPSIHREAVEALETIITVLYGSRDIRLARGCSGGGPRIQGRA